ncbi:MAG: tetratricopeptide repeat protein [SAR324 cluster bacterium]|nr:tetratricopeptide repeat protein [SAR324 cluster bacterium]
MSEQRISRKELHQPDRIQKWLYTASNFIFKNQKWFIAGSIALVVIIIGILSGMRYYQTEQIKQANLLYEAQKAVNEAIDGKEEQQQSALKAIESFLADFPDEMNTAIAWTYLGKLYVSQKKWGQAEESYKKAAEHPKAIIGMINAAKLSLAVVYENQQQWDAANKILQSIEGENWRDVRWKNLAHIALMQGDKNTAKSNLEQLIKETPQSVFKREAESILLTLN